MTVILEESWLSECFQWTQSTSSVRELQSHLRDTSFQASNDWKVTAQRLLESNGSEAYQTVVGYLEKVARFSSKSVSLYDQTDEVRKFVDNLSADLPRSLDVDSFRPSTDDECEPFASIRDDNSTTVLFRTVRTLGSERDVQTDWIIPEFHSKLGSSPRITIRSTERIMTFDSIVLPHDSTKPLAAVATTTFRDRSAVEYASVIVPEFVRRSLRDSNPAILGVALNLFPAIAHVYANVRNARLGALTFDCTTGATRAERMRRARDTDLRDEAYHRAGAGVTDVIPFGAAIRLPGETASDTPAPYEVEVVLRGKREMCEGVEALTTADIRYARTQRDFDLALSNLREWVLNSRSGE